MRIRRMQSFGCEANIPQLCRGSLIVLTHFANKIYRKHSYQLVVFSYSA